MYKASARFPCVAHQPTHFGSTGTKGCTIAGIVEQRRLCDSHPVCTDRGFFRRLANMLQSCGIRFAGFGCASTYTAFKISVLGHCLAFHVPDAVPQQPARNDRTKTSGLRLKSLCLRSRPCWGRSGRLGAGHAIFRMAVQCRFVNPSQKFPIKATVLHPTFATSRDR